MPESVLDILQEQIVPQIDQFGLSQLMVARAALAEMPQRTPFRFTPQPLLGPRQGVRSFTFGMTTAKWPKDNLVETSCPLLTFILEGDADMRFGDYWLHATAGQGVFALADVPRKAGQVPLRMAM